MIIQEKTIEKVMEEVASNEVYSEEIRTTFNTNQEDYIAYLEKEVYSLISDPEKDLMLFMLYSINEFTSKDKGNVASIELHNYFDTEEEMWKMYEEKIKSPFKERITPFFEAIDEEEALAFVEDLLIEAENEEDEDLVIDPAGRDVIWNVCAAFIKVVTLTD
jgi:hypothetical protein